MRMLVHLIQRDLIHDLDRHLVRNQRGAHGRCCRRRERSGRAQQIGLTSLGVAGCVGPATVPISCPVSSSQPSKRHSSAVTLIGQTLPPVPTMLATARTFFLQNREGGAVLASSALFMAGAMTLIWLLG